jgi:hypothetical protein
MEHPDTHLWHSTVLCTRWQSTDSGGFFPPFADPILSSTPPDKPLNSPTMFSSFLFLSSCAIPLKPDFPVLYFESFDGPGDDWLESTAPGYNRAWSINQTAYPQTHEGERALIEATGRGLSAVSHRFPRPINVANKTLVLQYEMRAQFRYRCLTAGIKLFSDPQFDPSTLTNETEYTILFGPDVCAFSRVAFELGFRNPDTNRIEIHNFTDSPPAPKDRKTHLFTLIIRPDATFSILIDTEQKKEGNLFYDLSPGFSRGAAQSGLDKKPAEFTAIGFEVFDVDHLLAYSKILIADNEEAVKKFNEESFLPRKNYQDEQPEEAERNEQELNNRRRRAPAAKKAEKIGFGPALQKTGRQIGKSLKKVIGDVSPVMAGAAAVVLIVLIRLCCCGGRKKKTQ